MKAIIYADAIAGNGDVRVAVLYYSGAVFQSASVVSLAGTDFDATSLPADTLAAILADAVTNGYSITAADIIDGMGLPVLPTKAFEGTTLRSNPIPVSKSATVSSGTAVFNLTVDGLSTGASLFPNGVIKDSVSLTVSDATASYQMSYAFTNSDKTLTVTANKLTTSNILTGILGQAAANAAVVKLSVIGY